LLLSFESRCIVRKIQQNTELVRTNQVTSTEDKLFNRLDISLLQWRVDTSDINIINKLKTFSWEMGEPLGPLVMPLIGVMSTAKSYLNIKYKIKVHTKLGVQFRHIG